MSIWKKEHANAKLHAFVTRQTLDEGDYLIGSTISLCGINPTMPDPDFRARVSEVDTKIPIQGDVCSKCKKSLDAMIHRQSIPLSEELWVSLHEEMNVGDIYAFQLRRKNGIEEIFSKNLISKGTIGLTRKGEYTDDEKSGENFPLLMRAAAERLFNWHKFNDKPGFDLLNLWSPSKPIWVVSRFENYSCAFDPKSFDSYGRKIQAKKNGTLMSMLEIAEILVQCSRRF